MLGVFTAADLDADGVRPMPCVDLIENRDGTVCNAPGYPILARTRARFVGQPVVLVVAESAALARDAAEQVQVDYEPLPAVVEPRAAMAADAPQLWDQAPGNLCADWGLGESDRVDAAFENAAHLVRLSLVNNRVAPSSLEPRGALGPTSSND